MRAVQGDKTRLRSGESGSIYQTICLCVFALLRIQNDLLLASNQQNVSALILLDLSAAFDTIDHQILLTRLSSTFGFSDTALSLITSYLTNRSQYITIGDHCSNPTPLTTGVPQGSVLGPLLFTLYTTPIGHILSKSPVSFHLYADDTQLYISFSPSDSTANLSVLSSTLDTIHSWLSLNRLSVNPAKTEYLLIGTHQQRTQSPTLLSHFKEYQSLQALMRATSVLNLTLTSPMPNISRTFVAHPFTKFASSAKSDPLLTQTLLNF